MVKKDPWCLVPYLQLKLHKIDNNLNNELPEAETVKIDEVTTEVVSEPLEFVE